MIAVMVIIGTNQSTSLRWHFISGGFHPAQSSRHMCLLRQSLAAEHDCLPVALKMANKAVFVRPGLICIISVKGIFAILSYVWICPQLLEHLRSREVLLFPFYRWEIEAEGKLLLQNHTQTMPENGIKLTSPKTEVSTLTRGSQSLP